MSTKLDKSEPTSKLDVSRLSIKLDSMDAADLFVIARHWSNWDSPPPPSVPRQLALPSELRPDVALVIQGVRRAGKSTLMGQLPARFGLDPARCLTINFEDPRLASALDFTVLEQLVAAFESESAGERGPGTYFLDEIQHVTGWQRWLRAELDRPRGRRFVVTGSNAHLLSGELATSLTDRHLSVELYPFDLAEYRELRPRASLLDYLGDGGFPAPLAAADGDLLRRAYFDDIVARDVREHVGARSVQPVRQLAQMVFEAAGSELSVRRLAAAIGVAPDTGALYLDAIENAYLAFGCPFFTWSARRRSARNRKYYPVDTGLRRVCVTRTGADRGKMLECATYLLLRRRFGEVAYWRGRGEVDFVVLRGGEPVPVQVSWDEPAERHRKGVDEFHAEFPRGHEPCFVTAESFAAGLPELEPA
jgi:predicted AAA+ superfamily ATPase